MYFRSFAVLGLALAFVPAGAQSTPGGAASGPPGGSVQSSGQMGRDALSAQEFNALQDYADMAKRLKGEKNQGKTVEDLMKEDLAAATNIAAGLPLACHVDKAVLAAQGPVTMDGKSVQTQTYETVCSNGMGYFLTSHETNPGAGITCFAAHTLSAADTAAGRKPGMVCALPELADTKAMATKVMTNAGVSCNVRDWRWVGSNNTSHVEFEEVACADNTGYIVTIPLPGSTSPVRTTTCRDSNARGLPCKLSDNGGEPLTAMTFKNALKQRSVSCDAADKDVLMRGQETNLKRFVVEFKCTQHPEGLVAYIPLNGNKAPFEVVDCVGAGKRGIKCALKP